MHPKLSPALLFSLLSITSITATFAQTLSANRFPACAQFCAYNIPTAGCVGTDDACLCTNIPYLTSIAACIGLDCTAAGVSTSADVFIADCNTSGVTLAMSKAEFVAAANGALSSAAPTRTTTVGEVASPTDASPTTSQAASETTKTTTTNAPQQTGSTGGGLSTSDKIALGVGIGFGIPAVIAAIATCWMCLRGR